MENTMIPTTSEQMRSALTTSFGMPTRGCASAWSIELGTTGTRVRAAASILRDRKAVAAKGHVAFVANVPGSPAWSPPI